MPERQRRRSFFLALAMSTIGCVPVRLCTVVIMPLSMPSSAWITLITGAMQLVVHEAAVQMTCSAVSFSSLTPTTTLSTDGSLTGADTTTRFTPHVSRYGCSAATVRNLPVQSITSSTPLAAQSTCVKSSFSLKETLRPSTVKLSADGLTHALGHVPCTESYLTRYAAVSAPPTSSLTWTTSTSGISNA